MNRLASPAQLRASFLRWALFLVPTIVLLGLFSGMVAGSGGDNPWFMQLNKPAIYPPAIAFPIVWTTLYVLMGLALAFVCAAWGARYRALAILMFVLQFALNLAWSPVFFGYHEIALALYLLIAIDIAVAITLLLFWRVRRAAGLLLVPYLCWVLFATVLNWQFLAMNPDASGKDQSTAVQRITL